MLNAESGETDENDESAQSGREVSATPTNDH